MSTYTQRVGISVILASLLFTASVPSVAQEHETESTSTTHGSTEAEFHPNHFGGLIGASTHSDTDDKAITLGLDYVRQFTKRWAAAAYVELVSSDLERDVVVAVCGVFYATRSLAFMLGPGVESATKDVDSHGNIEQEKELELLVRMGVAYAFRFTPQAAIGPIVLVDRAGGRWNTVLGVGMAVGF
jgi:hypothetical protein